jgi:hypothetical protein
LFSWRMAADPTRAPAIVVTFVDGRRWGELWSIAHFWAYAARQR